MDLNKLTKKELVSLLNDVYDANVTTRPRKSTLITLLEQLREEAKIKQKMKDNGTFVMALVIVSIIALVIVAGVSGVI